MSAHRRPLATAGAAAGVLFALWFVPSANASPDTAPAAATAPAQHAADHADAGRPAERQALPELRGARDTDGTVYVIGGLGAAGVGALLAARAARRRGA
ncbi:hypothetical protein HOY81_03040 [Streptomyces sp. JJ36]|nr:hypothetical protein [Streptomyces sp. JJ36]